MDHNGIMPSTDIDQEMKKLSGDINDYSFLKNAESLKDKPDYGDPDYYDEEGVKKPTAKGRGKESVSPEEDGWVPYQSYFPGKEQEIVKDLKNKGIPVKRKGAIFYVPREHEKEADKYFGVPEEAGPWEG